MDETTIHYDGKMPLAQEGEEELLLCPICWIPTSTISTAATLVSPPANYSTTTTTTSSSNSTILTDENDDYIMINKITSGEGGTLQPDDQVQGKVDPSSLVGVSMASGPCGHALCIKCLDQMTLQHQLGRSATARSRNQQNDTIESLFFSNGDAGTIAAITLSFPCPLCRTDVSMFDFKYTETNQPVIPLVSSYVTSSTPTPSYLSSAVVSATSSSSSQPTTNTADESTPCTLNTLGQVVIPPEPKVGRVVSLPEPLRNGAIYYQPGKMGGIGRASYHFPTLSTSHTSGLDDENNNNNNIQLPYMNIENIPGLDDESNAGDLRPHMELMDVQYHESTRTLLGYIRFEGNSMTKTTDPSTPSTSNADYDSSITTSSTATNTKHLFTEWRIVLSFSYDWMFIRHGAVTRRYRPQLDYQKIHPLDGTWNVQYSRQDDSGIDNEMITREIAITKSMFLARERVLRLQLHRSSNTIHIIDALSQKIFYTTQWDFASYPCGPAISGSIEWTLNQQEQEQLQEQFNILDENHRPKVQQWTRLGQAPKAMVKELTICLGGDSGHVYIRADRPTRPIPTYHQGSLWGNTFCQANLVGLASYHFVSQHDKIAYISYEHPATAQWPPLDNGMPVPDRVYFHNVTVDDETRIFRGQICWMQDYGASWQGNILWEYEMTFDSQFMCISGGQVRCVSNTDGDQSPHLLSEYGNQLVYVNAALYTSLQQSNRHVNSEPDAYQTTTENLFQRSFSENIPMRCRIRLNQIMEEVLNPDGTDPIDYYFSESDE